MLCFRTWCVEATYLTTCWRSRVSACRVKRSVTTISSTGCAPARPRTCARNSNSWRPTSSTWVPGVARDAQWALCFDATACVSCRYHPGETLTKSSNMKSGGAQQIWASFLPCVHKIDWFLVAPCCSQGVTLQVTLRCHLSVWLSVLGRTPLCWIDHPPTPCQPNTAELKRLHLICDGSMDSKLICDGRVMEWEIRIANKWRWTCGWSKARHNATKHFLFALKN